MITAVLALALLQVTPTGPVVVGYTPSNQAFQMFADGSVVFPPIPVTPDRLPPQDNNDFYVKMNKFARAVCGRVTNGLPAPDPECATFKITTGK